VTQRDQFVALLISRATGPNRWVYDNSGARCTNPHGADCSSFQSRGLTDVGDPYPCTDTDMMAADLQAKHLTITRAQARATKGAWAIRTKTNPLIPGDGHMVCSLGDGRTVEAHDHADGCYIGTFDGNRGFQVFGYPPGLQGFNQPPGLNPGPTTPQEARDMGMTAAKIVPGSHVQNKDPWFERFPFVGAIHQPNGTTDIVGFNGAKITNPKTVTAFGMSVLHLGTLQSPIEDIDGVDADTVVALAGDGGSFSINVVAQYI
jgi:hypothetical protein